METVIKDPTNGDTVVSTIDMNIQRIVQKAIKKYMKKYCKLVLMKQRLIGD